MTAPALAVFRSGGKTGIRLHALTIARFTIHEAISRRLILAASVLSLLFVGVYALGFSFVFTNAPPFARGNPSTNETATAGTVLTVLGLYAVHFLSSFIALFLTVGAISSEIDSGTLHAVLARPIRRADVVLGRWLAYSGLIGLYVLVMGGAILGLAWLIAGYQAFDTVRALGLMALGAILLLTVSLLGSTMFSTLANGVVAFTLFGLAWLGGIIEFTGGVVQNVSMVNLGIVMSLFVPSDAIWKAASFYAQSPLFLAIGGTRGQVPFIGSAPPTAAMILWALGYVIVFLALAVRAFSKRDL
jgi:ABC-type transport system involved in multi-copper enzyme maturation permease subunit